MSKDLVKKTIFPACTLSRSCFTHLNRFPKTVEVLVTVYPKCAVKEMSQFCSSVENKLRPYTHEAIANRGPQHLAVFASFSICFLVRQ